MPPVRRHLAGDRRRLRAGAHRGHRDCGQRCRAARPRRAGTGLLAGKRVTVTPYIAELFEGFSGSAAPDDLATLFELIYLYATRPRVDGRFYAEYESTTARAGAAA